MASEKEQILTEEIELRCEKLLEAINEAEDSGLTVDLEINQSHSNALGFRTSIDPKVTKKLN